MTLPHPLKRILADAGDTLHRWSDRPWIGWLLLTCIILAGLGVLAFLVLALVIVWAVASHGAGELHGGISVALWWFFALLAVVPISLFRIWWHFARGDRPGSIHDDLEAAQAGDGSAAHRLGHHYGEGDPASARAWLLSAACAGKPEAMVDLALMLREGRGGPRDLTAARVWLARAAEAGHPKATAWLAEVDARLADRHTE